MMAFDVLFPQLGAREMRTMTFPELDGGLGGTYLFREFYCATPGCECRRVVLNVHHEATGRQVATISHAFEALGGTFGGGEKTVLDPLNPQSELAQTMLQMFKDMLGYDPAYEERLERHYDMFKDVVNDATHPMSARVRSVLNGGPAYGEGLQSMRPYRRATPKVGPNEPCPCGSGRKYKVCCRISA